jgi:hypothetical protein
LKKLVTSDLLKACKPFGIYWFGELNGWIKLCQGQSRGQDCKFGFGLVGNILWGVKEGTYKLVMPADETLEERVFKEMHDKPSVEDLAWEKTLERIRWRFWWPGWAKDVTWWVDACLNYKNDKLELQAKMVPCDGWKFSCGATPDGEKIEAHYDGERFNVTRGMPGECNLYCLWGGMCTYFSGEQRDFLGKTIANFGGLGPRFRKMRIFSSRGTLGTLSMSLHRRGIVMSFGTNSMVKTNLVLQKRFGGQTQVTRDDTWGFHLMTTQSGPSKSGAKGSGSAAAVYPIPRKLLEELLAYVEETTPLSEELLLFILEQAPW